MMVEFVLSLSPPLQASLDRLIGALEQVAARPWTRTTAPEPDVTPSSSPASDATSVVVARRPSVEKLKSPPRVEASAAPSKAGKWATAARDDLLRRLWPTAMPAREVRRQLNELPGPPGPDGAVMGVRAAGKLGLKRPPDLYPANLHKKRAVAALAIIAPAVTAHALEAAVEERPRRATSFDESVVDPGEIRPRASALVAAVPRVHVPPEAFPLPSFPKRVPPAQKTGTRMAFTSGGPGERWTGERITLLRLDYGRRDPVALLEALNRLPGLPLTASWVKGYAEAVLGLIVETEAVA